MKTSGSSFRKVLIAAAALAASGSVFAQGHQTGGTNITVVAQPGDQTVFAGQSAFFSVTASTAVGNLTYQWQRLSSGSATWTTLSDGGNYSGTRTAALAVNSTTTAMSRDRFRCALSNGVQSSDIVSSEATLTVNPVPVTTTPPTITAQPLSQSVNVGGNVTLTVAATGTAPLTYQWRKDGVAISGATGATLTLSSVQTANAGTYSVLVTNSAGSVTSSSAVVSVSALPIITSQPVNQTVVAGSTVTLSVAVTGGAPFTYQWRKDGVAINGATTASLTLSNVQTANAGSYTVAVANSAGSVTSNAATITIGGPPVITSQPAGQTVGVSTGATFSVAATGTAPLTYQWRKDGIPIGGGTSATLTMTNVQASDAGGYSVVVTNAVGTATSTAAALTVGSSFVFTTLVHDNARFDADGGFVVDASGNLYIAAASDHTINKITPSGVVTVIAGQAGTAGSADGVGANARFSLPAGVAMDTAGNLYVADYGNGTIRRITPTGTVTTLAGVAGSFDNRDGVGIDARFDGPEGITLDAAGNIYVADYYTGTIRKITPAGSVSTLAGLAYDFSNTDGVGSNARFDGPIGIVVDPSGNLYVTDVLTHTVRKITSSGSVTTLVGAAYSPGSQDGAGSVARFNGPDGIVIDKAGNLYIADLWNSTIRKVAPSGVVTTVAGAVGEAGTQDGIGTNARFSNPANLALDSASNLYLSSFDYRVRKGILSSVAPASAGRLSNLSILTPLAAGETMTLGVVLGGSGTSGTKPLLVRAAGPSLTPLGVAGAMTDPRLSLFSGQAVIGSNDNWSGNSTLISAFNAVGAFAYTSTSSLDAAIYNSSMAAGSYTVQINGVGSSSGVVIAELYDGTSNSAFTTSTPRLINISMLKQINAGVTVTMGFVVGGSANRTVLVRAIGPTLGSLGVGGAMADPKLDLFRGPTVINSNNDWGGGVTLASAFASVGAFGLNTSSRDAAMVVILAPGNYTAQVTGFNGSAGTALLEVYEVP